MDFNIDIRKKQLDNLDQLVTSSRQRIQSVLSYLNWSTENVQKENTLIQCPVNAHHRISPKSWTEHMKKCILSVEGYNSTDQFLSESVDNPTQLIYLDRTKKIELITKELADKGTLRLEKYNDVITQLNINYPYLLIEIAWNGLDPDPRTADRALSTYSSDERLIFYNFCVRNTVGPPPPSEFTTIHSKKGAEEKPPSYEELLAQERDAKRRRTKYRSVHLNRKKYTEVIKEVIDGQMEEYKEWLMGKQMKDEECNSNNVSEMRKDQERPHSSTSRNSNHSSSSRSTSRKYDYRQDRHDTNKRRSRRSKDRNLKHDVPKNSKSGNNFDERLSTRKRDRRYSSRERERRGSSRERSRHSSNGRERRHSTEKGKRGCEGRTHSR